MGISSFVIPFAAAAPPNVIIILADDMGYADLGCYGATRIKTPHLDSLAKEGIRFTDGHSGGSTCTSTRYGLLTGRYNFRSWLTHSALATSAPALIEEDRVTIASFLKSNGYGTYWDSLNSPFWAPSRPKPKQVVLLQ